MVPLAEVYSWVAGNMEGEERVCRGVEAEGQWLVTLHRPTLRLPVAEQEVVSAWSDKRKSLDLHY